MSGAFRDASAAIERAAMLEQENEELRRDLNELATLRDDADERDKLRQEVAALRAIARGENEDAYLRRLAEERDELRREVAELKRSVREKEALLAKQRFAVKRKGNELGPLLTSLIESIAQAFRGSSR